MYYVTVTPLSNWTDISLDADARAADHSDSDSDDSGYVPGIEDDLDWVEQDNEVGRTIQSTSVQAALPATLIVASRDLCGTLSIASINICINTCILLCLYILWLLFVPFNVSFCV
jgi:hypothetical protein